LFFHQPRNKIEIGFPILNAVVPLDERAPQPKGEVLKPEIHKNLFDDIRRRLVLKNAAIGRARKEPQPRHHLRMVRSERAILAALSKAADISAEITFRTV